MSFAIAHWVTERKRLFKSSGVVISVKFQWLSTTSANLNEEAATGAVWIMIKMPSDEALKVAFTVSWKNFTVSLKLAVYREQCILRDRTEPPQTRTPPCPGSSGTYLCSITISVLWASLPPGEPPLCLWEGRPSPEHAPFTSTVTRLCVGSKGLIPKWILCMCNLILHNCWKLEST